MGRTSKQTRKFAASGQLKKVIQARKKHQEIKRKVERRKGPAALSKDKDAKMKGKGRAGGKPRGREGEEEEEDAEMSELGSEKGGKGKKGKKASFKGMSVDDFLGGGFLEGGNDDEVRLLSSSSLLSFGPFEDEESGRSSFPFLF